MLKDITLGQYLPGNSVVHRLDPRTKILLIVGFIVALFCTNSIFGYVVAAVFVAAVNHISGITFKMVTKSIKPLMFFIIFTAVINLFLTDGRGMIWEFGIIKLTWEGIYLTVIMSLRLIFLVVGTSVLTYTTSPIILTDGIEALMHPLTKIGVPSHEIAMMMTIALRFIPTIIDETDKIMKAQSARGSDFESGSLIHRAKALIPILVPLFISAFRRADELAVAMECRGYRGGANRTKLKQLKFGTEDLGALIVCIIAFAVMICCNLIKVQW